MSAGTRGREQRFDWDRARSRLAAAEPSEESERRDAERVLSERAVRLSQPQQAPALDVASLEVITFEHAGRRYAIESRCVLEVTTCGPLSRVPGARATLLGITNLRGELLPVFELASPSDARSASAKRLLVLGARAPELGLLVDAVDEVTALPQASLAEAQALGVNEYPEYVRGISAAGCVLLDGDAVLLDRRVFVANTPTGVAPGRDPIRENR